ncbi:GNAT family N-acetyltransferase [Nonomuraea spiralis]|uniref:GNAT family N-acetyltransferase n=1 Tax=Nonomuraea spiralis TaxID=46182 RepID=A0ABV5IF91_9ACTN|nr:GNAT family N-acetyltransferase [Nonomuraea spiralis]GGS71269.1 acetyltransferase [Nonomuraea spiralis]
MTLRRLTFDDLEDCSRLAEDRNWGAERHKWRLLFEVGEPYGIEAPDGDGLAATNVLTPYGDDHAVISMVLTASRYARRGLGRQLMNHVLERADGRAVSLYATEHGRPLYEEFGFRVAGMTATRTGVFHGEPSGRTRPATPADLEAILALDAEVFGTDRSPVLRRMSGFGEGVRIADGGYAHRWDNDGTTAIGPVVARDERTARDLIGDLALDAGRKIRIDLDLDREDLTRWTEEHGLTRAFTCAHMVWHGDLPGDRSRQFLPFMLALG